MQILYTNHAEEILKERGINKDEIEYTLKYPVEIRKKDCIYYSIGVIQRGKIEEEHKIR